MVITSVYHVPTAVPGITYHQCWQLAKKRKAIFRSSELFAGRNQPFFGRFFCRQTPAETEIRLVFFS